MLFAFTSCLNFCPDFFGHVGKLLDKKGYFEKTGNQIIAINKSPIIKGKRQSEEKF